MLPHFMVTTVNMLTWQFIFYSIVVLITPGIIALFMSHYLGVDHHRAHSHVNVGIVVTLVLGLAVSVLFKTDLIPGLTHLFDHPHRTTVAEVYEPEPDATTYVHHHHRNVGDDMGDFIRRHVK